MPFRPGWAGRTWRTIRDAVSPFGIQCHRADEMHGEIIMGDIWQSICSDRILIADVTNKNANVFYEIGLAHGIEKHVLLVSQSVRDIPFDLNRFRCILYKR